MSKTVRLICLCLLAMTFGPFRLALCACQQPSAALRAGSQSVVYADRTYVVSVPDPCLKQEHCGLIVDVHGTSMSPDMEESITHMRRLGANATQFGADTPYIVIQPAGIGHPSRWSEADARVVFDAIVCLADQLQVDPKRWHIGGFSLGAYLAVNIACAHPSAFASYGLIAGGADMLSSCMRTSGPAIYIHGELDDIVPFVMAQRLADAARKSVQSDGRVETLSPTRTRYVADSLWIETVFHQGRSPIMGAHCVPGGDGPIGCAADFDTGTELLKFYIAHPRN